MGKWVCSPCSAYYTAIEKIMNSLPNNTRVRNQLEVVPNDRPLIPGPVPNYFDRVPFFDPSSCSNERNLPNPDSPGRISLDKEVTDQTNGKLLKCNKLLKLSSFNVRTLNGPSQLNELILSMSSNCIDIIVIQEHR